MSILLKIVLILLTPIALIFPQNNNASLMVTASLIKGLGSEIVSGDLDFGEIILTDVSSLITKTPDDGISIKLNGHPAKDVMLNFSSAEMTNIEWVSEYGGNEGTIFFNPVVEHTSANSTYISAVPVSSGNSYTLENLSGDGLLYLWIGGDIIIDSDQPAGNYSGIFQINISY